VHAELRKALSLDTDGWQLCHFRDKDRVEVDFVLESPLRQLMGIEVKASATVNASDFKSLKRLQSLAGCAVTQGACGSVRQKPQARSADAPPSTAIEWCHLHRNR
jgi:predicted AAA+ superfamily ATPase